MNSRIRSIIASLLILLTGMLLAQQKPAPSAKPGLLTAEEVKAALPESVFFRGQKAPVQLRNTGGVRFGQGKLLLAAMVDNSGYSTGIAEKYQAYLITETKLKIGNHELIPGAYGCGIAGGKLIVMDLAANDLFSVPEENDAKLNRPRPLQITANGGAYRLYFGKKFVSFAAVQ
ncbi:MAG: hypothetical protein M3P27_06570 [Acidobacteriota bacterium]|nr:hypothetical protein [Acidobacteriota bacterium]